MYICNHGEGEGLEGCRESFVRIKLGYALFLSFPQGGGAPWKSVRCEKRLLPPPLNHCENSPYLLNLQTIFVVFMTELSSKTEGEKWTITCNIFLKHLQPLQWPTAIIQGSSVIIRNSPAAIQCSSVIIERPPVTTERSSVAIRSSVARHPSVAIRSSVVISLPIAIPQRPPLKVH